MDKYLLQMEHISKSFPGVRALNDVTLNVGYGSVHALLGENGAGKSTLMKCLFGIYHMDEGRVLFEGEEVQIKSSLDALRRGISMVHQELNQVKTTRIVDNIWLGRFPMKGMFVDEKAMYQKTKEIFNDLGIDLDPRLKTEKLTVSQAQMVEIAKAVSYDSKLIVMDEPTSSLSQKEVDQLFVIIRKLQEKNVSIIYISHKLDEIKEIADEVTILRDGTWITTKGIDELTTGEMINLMVGRSLDNRFPEITHTRGEVIMEVENLTAMAPDSIKDVTFNLHRGEILGVAGLVGAKRTDLLECLFGERTIKSGTIKLHGKEIVNKNPAQAIANKFALVTEERRATGIFGDLSIRFNATISNLGSYLKHYFLNDKALVKSTAWVIDSMRVKTPTQRTKIKSLSGGNQQKVIIGRWLLTEPDIFLMDEPTRGIDVGAKYEIYQLMMNLAKDGKAVMMVSSELPEIIGVSDRILVMSNGHLAGVVDGATATQEEILRLSALYL